MQRARHHEDDDGFALDLVRYADRCRFRHGGMCDGRGLDLRRTDALARDLEGVVAAPFDVPVAFVVDARPVAVDPGVRQARLVGVEVAALLCRRIAPDTVPQARLELT